MASKTLINGTAYDINGGRTLINGTGYDIKKGRTLVNGTGYDIAFGQLYLVRFLNTVTSGGAAITRAFYDGVTYSSGQFEASGKVSIRVRGDLGGGWSYLFLNDDLVATSPPTDKINYALNLTGDVTIRTEEDWSAGGYTPDYWVYVYMPA